MQFAESSISPSTWQRRVLRLRLGFVAALVLGMSALAPCRAQLQVQVGGSGSQPAQAAHQPASRAAPVASQKPVALPRPALATKPEWKELSTAQQMALKPLANIWNPLSETHKRKWLAISANFHKLPAAEQGKLQERMTEWVALSPVQRNQARLNFAKTTELSPAEKQAKWEAYQALSPEEKQKLAERAPKPPAGAATTVKPVPKAKLATASSEPASKPAFAKIPALREAPPTTFRHVDRNTLLPQQP